MKFSQPGTRMRADEVTRRANILMYNAGIGAIQRAASARSELAPLASQDAAVRMLIDRLRADLTKMIKEDASQTLATALALQTLDGTQRAKVATRKRRVRRTCRVVARPLDPIGQCIDSFARKMAGQIRASVWTSVEDTLFPRCPLCTSLRLDDVAFVELYRPDDERRARVLIGRIPADMTAEKLRRAYGGGRFLLAFSVKVPVGEVARGMVELFLAKQDAAPTDDVRVGANVPNAWAEADPPLPEAPASLDEAIEEVAKKLGIDRATIGVMMGDRERSEILQTRLKTEVTWLERTLVERVQTVESRSKTRFTIAALTQLLAAAEQETFAAAPIAPAATGGAT